MYVHDPDENSLASLAAKKRFIPTNLKLPIRITLKQLDSTLYYFESSGYTIDKKDYKNGFITYMTDAPGYGLESSTPLADVVVCEGNRRKVWMYIRLPRTEKSVYGE